MNDLSPSDPSAAPAPTSPPGPIEVSDSAETGAQAEPTPAVESSASPEPPPERAEASPPAASGVGASASPPAPNLFALPLVSEEEPCGPDLDLAGDAEFMNFVAATEGMLPASYYAFNRASIDFSSALATGEKLLTRTLDIRLLALMAKLAILNRDVEGFAQRVGNIAWLVKVHWQDANPRAEGEDYSGRIAQLITLDDNAVVLMPLQYAPLLDTSREGALCYRDQLLATGAAQPRSVTLYDLKGQKQTSEAEKFLPAKSIERILSDVEIGRLVGAVETLANLGASVQAISAATVEHVGYESVVELPKLTKLVGEMTEFLRAALVRRDPSLAPPAEAPTGAAGDAALEAAAAAPAAFASRAEVDAALASALGYFATFEPTSPALLLIRQAREALGKNLYEVMKLLAPPQADAARIFVGPDGVFTVPVKSLSSAPSAAIQSAPAEPATTRAAALALIDAVAAHMQKAEPSSPVPYLLDRARSLATRDFLSLLQDLLSDEAIAALKKGK